jgi:hypothetical protein
MESTATCTAIRQVCTIRIIDHSSFCGRIESLQARLNALASAYAAVP